MQTSCGELLERARQAALSLPKVGEVASQHMVQRLVNNSVTPAYHSNSRCAEITNGLLCENPGLFNTDKINELLSENPAQD